MLGILSQFFPFGFIVVMICDKSYPLKFPYILGIKIPWLLPMFILKDDWNCFVLS